MMRIYWCEFPEKVDWEKLSSWLDRDIIIYVACRSRSEYETKKRKLETLSRFYIIRAWPILSFNEGYWFSGFCSKKSIDKLDQFEGIPFKIDIEPPKPKGGYTFFMSIKWLIFNSFKRPKNRLYLQEKITKLLEKENIIISCFPLPHFLLKRWGWVQNSKATYNYMHYSTFLPFFCKWLYNNFYYRFFVQRHKDSFFAVGLIGTGIFGNEPIYKSIAEMKYDIKSLQKLGAKNLVFFHIGAIVERGKDWYKATLE
jgi:hypothetical protein